MHRFCERNMAALLRGVFPVERKKPAPRFRRWEAESYGEVFQHDSTPRRIWGGADSRQSIIMSLDDATRRVMALRVCERECLLEHLAMLEDSFRLHGLPETLYTDGFTMFGKEGVDLCSRFGRMCRAFGICHRIAPTPQAKGKIERTMRTFQHRLVVVLRAEGADSEVAANEIAARHIAFWNASHVSEETGQIPDERAKALLGCGRSRMRPPPCDKVLRLFLSRHEPRRVELGTRIEFMGLRWRIARTLKKTVWLAIRPKNAGFYILEERPDPTNPVVPRILAAYRFCPPDPNTCRHGQTWCPILLVGQQKTLIACMSKI